MSLEPTVGVQTEANRTAVAQILDEAIYPDLRYAVENLPTQQTDYGRIDVYGANFFSLMFCYLMKGAAKSSLKKLLD